MTTDNDKLLRRIRELEQEVAEWKARISQQRYGLVWMEVPESFDEESKNRIPILEEDVELGFTQNDNQPTHILIEGDNYHSLTCLNYTHRNQVDVIYIDPPYNTGNDGFIYRDERFLEERPDGQAIKGNHPMRHSTWLSFMAKRLRLAEQLLTDTGVIFISIDDNEQANLKLLCDKIFGEQNFVAQMIWSAGRKNDSKYISVSHEYILIYAKSVETLKSKKVIWRERKQGIDDIYAQYQSLMRKYKDDYAAMTKGLNDWYKSLPNGHPAKDHKHYNKIDAKGIFFPDNISWPGGGGPKYELIHPVTGKAVIVPSGGYRYTYNAMQKLLAEDKIYFGEDEKRVPCQKSYLHDRETSVPYSVIYQDGRAATKRLMNLFGKKVFDNPKDEEIIQRLISFAGHPNSIVLDFFAGSGTTMHAVSSLNAKDGGRRQCILCQASEADICRSVTLERNRRVMQGYTNAKGEEVKGLGGSLKYYRTAFVGRHTAREASDADRIDLAARAGCLLALAENTLYETERRKHFQLFTNRQGQHTAIYFSEDYSDFPTFETQVRQLEGSICIYVFSWGDGTEFAPMFDDLPNVVVKSIPQPILDIYKSLNT
ncbi:MAG: site-specific DNA-methyltransferase [Bacteroidaceae bacterium]|nr:site-specific DNA-methyltransferase [Bacteroidaceae bacterium]